LSDVAYDNALPIWVVHFRISGKRKRPRQYHVVYVYAVSIERAIELAWRNTPTKAVLVSIECEEEL